MQKCPNEKRMATKKDLDKLMKKDRQEDDKRYVKKPKKRNSK